MNALACVVALNLLLLAARVNHRLWTGDVAGVDRIFFPMHFAAIGIWVVLPLLCDVGALSQHDARQSLIMACPLALRCIVIVSLAVAAVSWAVSMAHDPPRSEYHARLVNGMLGFSGFWMASFAGVAVVAYTGARRVD